MRRLRSGHLILKCEAPGCDRTFAAFKVERPQLCKEHRKQAQDNYFELMKPTERELS